MKRTRKASNTPICMPSAMSGPQGWAELPDGLLDSIVALLGLFRDLLAFGATCPRWRASFLSAKSTLTTFLPPLLIECTLNKVGTILSNAEHTWNLSDPANPNSSFHHPAPENILCNAKFLGCSYGHAIFSSGIRYYIIDVFTGAEVSPPLCPFVDRARSMYASSGALTAPVASPGSYLLVCTLISMFAWRVGSDSWLQYHFPVSNGEMRIDEVVSFKGQVFGMFCRRLYTVHLEPQLSIQELAVVWGDNMAEPRLYNPWLVVCGDMLLLIGSREDIRALGHTSGFEAFWLDLSAEPAKWVKVEKLEKWAVFISYDERSQPLSCMNPERWGGRSNTIYCTGLDEGWTAHELTGAPDDQEDMSALSSRRRYSGRGLRASWVFPPSMLSSND